MGKNITELVFIVDRSGSMCGLEEDTIGGFNSVLQRNREEEGEAIVSTVLFNQESEVVHDRVGIDEVSLLTRRDYQPGGSTALLDAVCGSIRHIDRVQRYMPQDHKADHVIFVIITDGEENASRRWRYADAKRMIEQHRDEGWEFIFLGANIDVAAESARLGIPDANVSRYVSDAAGTQVAYAAMADAVGSVRRSGVLRSDWNRAAEADAAARGR